MRTIWLVLIFLAVMALCIAGCPKGSKKIGGSLSGSSGGIRLGGPDIPSSSGQHIDIGYGWDTNLGAGVLPLNDGTVLGGANIYTDRYPPIKMLGTTIRWAYRMSATDKGMSGDTAMGASTVSLLVMEPAHFRDDAVRNAGEAGPSVDKSDPSAGYFYYEFHLPPSPPSSIGVYMLNAFDGYVLVQQ
ncbi:hypothetical protein A2V68_01320 [candidate division Kazan bacterium RBG_13_50_9]|uniref:Uncharacterized protein n=1 Tax=candidate division Kazan bacterium RBG_13_50_9 TaxID=1798535 RepID=A0A1F4NSU9_UNCK3|nr:MAG: hypothetical protein A2V68_01320 [candidate division Kazan bacterium RBG_13_50_9]